MIQFNEQNEVVTEDRPSAILVALDTESRSAETERSLAELAGLAEAAGVRVIGEMTQNLERPNTATYLGTGKVEELAEYCRVTEANLVIFDNELSGMQLRNLEEKLDTKVIDRTILILDIFADRAISREGKLQVEFAQLRYRLPRLTGFGKSLSRLGGGIGTRGPGETKLETDRRHIEHRMDEIRSELAEVRENRRTQRARREKAGIPCAALVGYTNSGKSAIMNRFLADAEKEEKSVFEKNMLFATLDTSQRRIRLADGREFILIDTVGFVSKLPHSLVDAFKATLEEVMAADLLIHVVDASFSEHSFQMEVTRSVLSGIGAGETDTLVVYNKCDLLSEEERGALGFPEGEEAMMVSAKTGEGWDALVSAVSNRLFGDRIAARLVVPYTRGDIVSYLKERYVFRAMEYIETGTQIDADLAPEDFARLKSYVI